jgi:RNA 3'-terminal phosphate cyclase (ATP)
MVTIDGSYREGGGQIIRTAIALSAITGKGVHIHHIRAGREKPGLRPQHLHSIEGAAEITGAHTEGISPGSSEVVFSPGRIRGGRYEIDTHTAGAVTLILQELVPLALFADDSIDLVLKGGTAVPYSPTIEYFRNTMCFFLKRMGISLLAKTDRHGFYPRGGGMVSVSIKPCAPSGLELIERGVLQGITALAIASQELQERRVAERLIEGFKEVFPGAETTIAYSAIPSTGCFLSSHARYTQSMVGADGLGKKGKRAEVVGRETADALEREIKSRDTIDRWMVDQLIVYVGLAAHFSGYHSRIAVGELTPHAETAIWVVNHFLPVKFEMVDGILHSTPQSNGE